MIINISFYLKKVFFLFFSAIYYYTITKISE